ncbi:glutathione S-transferase theta-1b isoform X2 [Hippoglossus hippoglossus]|uniref:glutathione S-transferase theta-1b isoform X2 n=1 Tax=Hippoglossus hippoglossus TaxID=8267 RepID=UPI00148BFFBF|nr:glutathione S-transferase theta-1b isoform X2 [Hippoglossus hippoglossus]
MELYLDLYSQPCRSVYIFASKNNIPFEFKKLSLLEGEQYGEEFGKINLIRKVPALRDGDFCLAESIAILLYLAEKFKTPDFWYPADLHQRACINEYLSWQHTTVRLHGSKMFWLRDKLDSALEDLNGSLKLLEEKFIQDKPFIAGDNFSLADLVAIVEVMQPVGSGLDVFEGRPKLSAWRDRVQAAIGKELFDDAHQSLLGAQESVTLMDASKMQFFKPKILKLFM